VSASAGDSPAVNPAAADGFGRAAAAYESARPSYPFEAVDYLVRTLGIARGRRVLDLAAGTGKLTRLLVPTGASVVAVEPVAAMRAALAEAVAQGPSDARNDPSVRGDVPSGRGDVPSGWGDVPSGWGDVEVLGGTAEAIPLPDGSVDVVVVAQAFHWFDASAALAEIVRVLRPGGGLGLVWNVRDESVDWVRRFTEITIARSGGTPYRRDYSFARWTKEFSANRDITPLASRRFRFDQDADIDLVVERAASISFVAAMDDHDRVATLEEVRRMLEEHPELQGRQRFPFPYETDVYWCHRRP
jgi:SAM-dependent methyltransferase